MLELERISLEKLVTYSLILFSLDLLNIIIVTTLAGGVVLILHYYISSEAFLYPIIWINSGSRVEIMSFMSDFKAPPTLNNEISYSQWKKELSIWQAFTNISKSKQTPAIFLSLTGQARDAITDFSLSDLTSDAGVDNLLAKLAWKIYPTKWNVY